MNSKRKGGGKDGGKKGGSYEVGYGKPPEHGKFKPGQSGNPQGRPVGSRNRNRSKVEQNRLRDIINQEAERIVTVQAANGKTKKITTAQGIIRAINLNALKGQQRAQRLAVELIGETQRLAQAEREENFTRWAKYKQDWSSARAVDKSAALPNPDHVKLDTDTLTVTIAGPAFQHEKVSWRRWTVIRAWVLEELKELQKFQDDADLSADIALLVKMAEEILVGIDLALGGSRSFMNFLERVYVSDIEAKCQKKRRRYTSYLFPLLYGAMHDRMQIEDGK
jgi:hypothetical protein